MSAVSPAAPTAHAADLYERHGSRVLRFCLGRLGSREDAEDATQTTFLNAVGALRRGTVPHAEAAWLLRIAENVCHQRHRTAARRKESACDPTVLADVVEAPPSRPDELIHLAAALESLPERQRRAVLLREWQGLSYHEIGAELGLSHSAVETLLFRARRRLAQALEQDGRRGLGIVSLLGWLKTAVGSLAGVKVAAAVVVVAVAVVPIRDAPATQAGPDRPARSQQTVLAPAAFVPAMQAAELRSVAAPAATSETGTAPSASTPRRGGHPAVVETEPPALATPTPAPEAADPAPPAATPPMSEPRREAPAPPVDPPVEVPPLPVPVPALPDVTGAVPTLPPLPDVPQLPELPAPKLPVPGLP